MQCGFMPGRTTEPSLVVRRMKEKYRDKEKKLHSCFVDIEKTFDRVPKKVFEWAKRKKILPKVTESAVMSIYNRVKIKIRVGSELSKEFWMQVGVQFINNLCRHYTFWNCGRCNNKVCKRRLDK